MDMDMDNIFKHMKIFKHIKDIVRAHLGNAPKDVVNALWFAHESCERGEWENDGELRCTLILGGLAESKVDALIHAFTSTTLVNDEAALDA